MAISDFLAEYGYHERHIPDVGQDFSGRKCIVCGDGWTIWDDLERFGCRKDGKGGERGCVVPPGPEWDFMVINKLGETFPGKITHWYSNEPALMNKFIEARRSEYKREFPLGNLMTHSINRGAKFRWPFGGHGTSGLGGTLVAVCLYREVVIAGMPLDSGPHNGEPPWRRCRFEVAEVADQKDGGMPMHWKRAMDLAFDGKVKALSGRPMKWLGSPI